MLPRDDRGILILDKLKLSSREIVLYLESINIKNQLILNLLKKKPVLPGYDKLPWVIEFKLDCVITKKLKNRSRLTNVEKERLTSTLKNAATGLKKMSKGWALEDYISNL